MSEIYELHECPDLGEPTLIVGLQGWVDSGLAAQTAVSTMLDSADTFVIATFDADALLDHRARRPTLRLVDGVSTEIVWPSIEIRAGFDSNGQSVLFLVGDEPDHQWRRFADAVLVIAEQLDVTHIVGFGAYPTALPHTRPASVIATSTQQKFLTQIGSIEGRIEVPAGVSSVIEFEAGQQGIDAFSLWAQVPHYASNLSFPAGSVALIEKLREHTGLEFPVGKLIEAAIEAKQHIDSLIENNPDHADIVRQLEEQFDAQQALMNRLAPEDGAELVAELEQFLREQD